MTDWIIWGAIVLGAVIAVWVIGRVLLGKAKRALLLRRFEDVEMVDTILDGRIAQGMSAEMVVAAWGKPADMDETVMKTKTKREMKYDQKGKNRFGTRVYLENGSVVGWETK